jgi:hypothetical protein
VRTSGAGDRDGEWFVCPFRAASVSRAHTRETDGLVDAIDELDVYGSERLAADDGSRERSWAPSRVRSLAA